MPELLLSDVPTRLMNGLREWAALRHCSVQDAAIEMIRIGLYETRRRDPAEGSDGGAPKDTES